MKEKLEENLRKGNNAELFNKEVMSNWNPDLAEAVRTSFDQGNKILELEEKLRVAEENEQRQAQLLVKKNKTRDQDERERTSQTLRNLRGLNVTMVRAVEKPIVRQNGEEQEAAQKLKLDMSNIQTALNMMNTAKKDSAKRELEKESADEENPPLKTLKLDGSFVGEDEKVVEGDSEDYEGEAGVEAEYIEEEENVEEKVVVEENEEEEVVIEANEEEKVVVEENEEEKVVVEENEEE